MDSSGRVSVVQADRDAAVAVYQHFNSGIQGAGDAAFDGRLDAREIVQAFARHRHDSIAELVEALEAELADLETDIRWANDSDLERLISRRERMEAALNKARPS